MAFVLYTPSANAWKNIKSEKYGQKFYPLQEGEGSKIKVVSPAEGSVQRAKSELKRQLSESSQHMATHKVSGRGRRRTTHPKNKSKKKKKSSSKFKANKVTKKKVKKITKKKKK